MHRTARDAVRRPPAPRPDVSRGGFVYSAVRVDLIEVRSDE
jgi:hypothetical protein